jgi:hypothetical protein
MNSHFRFFALIAVCLSSVFHFRSAQAQVADEHRVQVIFVDGSSIEVQDLVFVYSWHYTSDTRYINFRSKRKESLDFHYSERSRGISLDRSIPRSELANISLSFEPAHGWDDTNKKTYIRITRLLVTTIQGKKIAFEHLTEDGMFLTGRSPSQELKDPAVFVRLEIEAQTIIEGSARPFKTLVYERGGGMGKLKGHEHEILKQLVFLHSQ